MAAGCAGRGVPAAVPPADDAEPPRLHLTVQRSPEGILFKGDRSFRTIACRDSGPERQSSRYVWRAECSPNADCMQETLYGEPTLRQKIGPNPLVAGQCYECAASGRSGWGVVLFQLDAAGRVEPCDDDPS